MALNNLDRFVAAAAQSALARVRCSSAIREALPILLQIFSTSQYLSDLLITDPEATTCCALPKGSR